MPDRLLIVRPRSLGAALADAVERACSRPIAVTAPDLLLLDARLACGDFDAVRTLLRTPTPSLVLPVFVARYVTWTGDLAAAAGAWDAVLASLDLPVDRTSATLHRTACVEIARTATDLGDAPLAARLIGNARRHDTSADHPNDVAPPNADRDSMLICDVAFNVLGIQPDASRGRLRLRPRLDRFEELEAHNIRFGDGSVGISASRAGETIVVRVEQDAGAVPITVVLEPFVNNPATADVDGSPADLTPQIVDNGTILPVQLVLDQARTLTINTGSGDRT